MGVKHLQRLKYTPCHTKVVLYNLMPYSSHIAQQYGTGTATISIGCCKSMALWYNLYSRCHTPTAAWAGIWLALHAGTVWAKYGHFMGTAWVRYGFGRPMLYPARSVPIRYRRGTCLRFTTS